LKEKVVITGGAGFVGSNLGHTLNKKGYDVLLLDDLSFGHLDNIKKNGKAIGTFKKIDIRTSELKDHFSDADFVFHLAGISTLPICQSEPVNSIDVNVTGTVNVLEAARKSKVKRVIFASTAGVYENNTKFPCEEEDLTEPSLTYTLTKSFCEKLCKSYFKLYGLETCVTRYNNVYGPNQDIKRISPPFVAYVIREVLQNKQPVFHSDGNQQRDYVYIDDVNELNFRCMTNPNAINQIFNVSSGKVFSVNEIYLIIASLLNSKIKPIFRNSQSFWDKYPSLFKGSHVINKKWIEKEVDKFALSSTEKAEKLLNWKATTSMEDGLKQTIEFTQKLLK
jgi:nucleoside-diphosphate-sugar epimerase